MNTNRLSPGETERLAMLSEECGEVVQIIGKILRHGYSSTHLDDIIENRSLLECELGDLFCTVDLLTDKNDLDIDTIKYNQESKHKRVLKYTHHQELI